MVAKNKTKKDNVKGNFKSNHKYRQAPTDLGTDGFRDWET